MHDSTSLLLGVFDGHGRDGDRCSDYARQTLGSELQQRLQEGRPRDGGQTHRGKPGVVGSQTHRVVGSQTHRVVGSQTHRGKPGVVGSQTHRIVGSQTHRGKSDVVGSLEVSAACVDALRAMNSKMHEAADFDDAFSGCAHMQQQDLPATSYSLTHTLLKSSARSSLLTPPSLALTQLFLLACPLTHSTTAITAFFSGTELIVANVGDSRAVLAERRGGRIIAHALSSDQTPYRQDERQRIR